MFPWTEPFGPLSAWFEDATKSEPRVPDAMQLATVDAGGRPSVRTVLLKAHGPDGLVFYTNFGSQKAREIDATGVGAICLHWKSLERQVHAEGRLERVDEATADAYHQTRVRGSQIGAWASRQSEPLDSPQALAERVAEIEARFDGTDVPRPPFWGGFRLIPDQVGFWQGRPDRLHDRWIFTRTADGWARSRAYP